MTDLASAASPLTTLSEDERLFQSTVRDFAEQEVRPRVAAAGPFVTFASVDCAKGYKGITAFIVERGFPGFSVGKKEDKLGIRASSTTELILDGCAVPRENVLGEVGKGYKIAIETLNTGRIGIGAQTIGVARVGLDAAVKSVKERKQFGKTDEEFQSVTIHLASDSTDHDAA